MSRHYAAINIYLFEVMRNKMNKSQVTIVHEILNKKIYNSYIYN